MIKGVIFDLDDTLYDYQSVNDLVLPSLYEFAATKLGISICEFEQAFEDGRKDTKTILKNTAAIHSRLLYCQHALERLGLNPLLSSLEISSYYWESLIKKIDVYPGVWELMSWLKSNDIRIGICSDMTTEIQIKKLRKLKLVNFIDVLVTSEEVGIEKPALSMFNLTLRKMGLQASEVLMVGDSYKKDILGAKNAGIEPIWFNQREDDSLDSSLFVIKTYEGLLRNEKFLNYFSK